MQTSNTQLQKDLEQRMSMFNSSIEKDGKMYKEEIESSIAHITMLGQCGIISKHESEKICSELEKIQSDIDRKILLIDKSNTNIYSFIEKELIKRIGDLGKKISIARSINERNSLNLRLYLSNKSEIINKKLRLLINTICDKALQNTKTLMPGYTHFQKTEPITFAHHIMAYSEMFLRDISRIEDAKNRMQEMPLGAGDLSSTIYPINRSVTTLLLGWEKLTNNSIDAVSDRDFCIELSSALSTIMVHLSRFCEEICIWNSSEFRFIEIDESFKSSSNIITKRNYPITSEIIRSKSGRVFGDTLNILTSLKSLPLAYSNDLQEVNNAIFDSIDTVIECIEIFTLMFESIKVLPKNMKEAAKKGFLNAIDCVYYLIKKGLSYNDAYQIVNDIILFCMSNDYTLENLPIEKYQTYSSKFGEDIFEAISLENCVEERSLLGGPSEYNMLEQIKRVRNKLEN